MVTQILEGVRGYTKKMGHECSIALPPLDYGGHPYHHIGMPGTIIMPEEVVKETSIYTMLGLWNDGYRKVIFVNNHGHLWMLESGIHEFCKRYQLPGLFRTIEWHRGVREFSIPTNRENSLDTNFIHADDAETAVAMLMFNDMIDTSPLRKHGRFPSFRINTSTVLSIPAGARSVGARAKAIPRSNVEVHLRE